MDPQLVLEENERWKEAWQMDYCSPTFVKPLEKLTTRLTDCETHPQKESFWRYLPIFQSSGFGKSRLIREFARNHFTIYWCLRRKNSLGFPPRHKLIADYLSKGFPWGPLLAGALRLLDTFEREHPTKPTPEEWYCYSQSDEAEKRLLGFTDDPATRIPHDALDRRSGIYVCIDEARSLLKWQEKEDGAPTGSSQFRSLRRILTTDSPWPFFILVDTLSAISNFAPTAANDPSARDPVHPRNIFLPYFTIQTTDALADALADAPSSSSGMDTPGILSLFRLGRPLWPAFLHRPKATAAFGSAQAVADASKASDSSDRLLMLVNFAARKLLCDFISQPLPEISTEAALAVLCCRFQLSVAPAAKLASTLVAAHMATCVSISEDRHNVLTTYPSEPVLAEAGCEIMSRPGVTKELLDDFVAAANVGVVDAGARGEAVARILLGMARDVAVRDVAAAAGKKRFYSEEISAMKFLEALAGPQAAEEYNAKTLNFFHDAHVSFTHFTPLVEEGPSKELARRLYFRRCASIAERNAPDRDGDIPIRKGNQFLLLPYQVKNWDSGRVDPLDSGYRLSASVCYAGTDLEDINVPGIFFQLGGNTTLWEVRSDFERRVTPRDPNPSRYGTLVLQGVSPTATAEKKKSKSKETEVEKEEEEEEEEKGDKEEEDNEEEEEEEEEKKKDPPYPFLSDEEMQNLELLLCAWPKPCVDDLDSIKVMWPITYCKSRLPIESAGVESSQRKVRKKGSRKRKVPKKRSTKIPEVSKKRAAGERSDSRVAKKPKITAGEEGSARKRRNPKRK